MTESTTCATPLEVLDAAIETLSAEDGYTVNAYHAALDADGEDQNVPVDRATMHCAIGGVEHAIWKLCGDDVTKRRKDYAYAGSKRADDVPSAYPSPQPRKPSLIVYRDVMKALNDETRSRKITEDGFGVGDVEQATFVLEKDGVLEIFRAARARLA